MAEFEDLAVFLMDMFHGDVKLQEDNNPKLLDMGRLFSAGPCPCTYLFYLLSQCHIDIWGLTGVQETVAPSLGYLGWSILLFYLPVPSGVSGSASGDDETW
jgi:hypothetical protein